MTRIKFTTERPTKPGKYLLRAKDNFLQRRSVKYVTLLPICKGSDALHVDGGCAVSAYHGAEWCELEVEE